MGMPSEVCQGTNVKRRAWPKILLLCLPLLTSWPGASSAGGERRMRGRMPLDGQQIRYAYQPARGALTFKVDGELHFREVKRGLGKGALQREIVRASGEIRAAKRRALEPPQSARVKTTILPAESKEPGRWDKVRNVVGDLWQRNRVSTLLWLERGLFTAAGGATGWGSVEYLDLILRAPSDPATPLWMKALFIAIGSAAGFYDRWADPNARYNIEQASPQKKHAAPKMRAYPRQVRALYRKHYRQDTGGLEWHRMVAFLKSVRNANEPLTGEQLDHIRTLIRSPEPHVPEYARQVLEKHRAKLPDRESTAKAGDDGMGSLLFAP
jgi:hypothetical protein